MNVSIDHLTPLPPCEDCSLLHSDSLFSEIPGLSLHRFLERIETNEPQARFIAVNRRIGEALASLVRQKFRIRYVFVGELFPSRSRVGLLAPEGVEECELAEVDSEWLLEEYRASFVELATQGKYGPREVESYFAAMKSALMDRADSKRTRIWKREDALLGIVRARPGETAVAGSPISLPVMYISDDGWISCKANEPERDFIRWRAAEMLRAWSQEFSGKVCSAVEEHEFECECRLRGLGLEMQYALLQDRRG